ncbi:MAG: hypothetical protein B7Y16_00310 [Methylotenera sp. 24-45-7]|jgi:uncharacterized membrane protein|nr:MAG: hypothetical protein B7Y72_04735 [Mehylophilales bacterium 35-46-6]OYZ41900.1 MAG: hypothetical protein B7Y16_00310 [Methylotenera sp. 24-45-7]OZA08078.1 MAG: hypothetical protein B7X97_07540 [Methylotenera sp. 17-45-7]OZA53805.1 MAG: hypothetical protein B7X73_03140 [Methylophilales bacterium 39-45-7]HQS37546.1 DUF2231 domain-containing protein [Methylotenera sp.]
MKLFNLSLFILSLAIGAFTPAFAADAPQETNTYQSSFDDYKPLSDDNLSDWKSINVPSIGGGHAGHSMAGMQHKMTSEQMANMSSESKDMPEMEGMDHSKMEGMGNTDSGSMEGMDHSQMKHDHAMAPMAGMDHSKMAGMEMDHGSMKSKSDNKQVMPSIKKEDMPEMSHDKMAGHDHASSDMKAMDHSKMSESKPAEMQASQDGAALDESQPHEHASEQGAEHEGMVMPSMAESKVQPTPWQIIPNFHPIVVHFPIALTIIAFLLSIAAYARRSHPISAQLAAAGHFTLWLAAIGAATAVLFGWLAFNSVNHDDAGHAAMLLHRSWAIPTALGLILLASWDAWKYRVNELKSVPMLFVLFLLSQAIAVTAWLGGEVVYRHGIGVLSLPASEGTGHGHHEGADVTATPKAGPEEHTEMNSDEKGESHEH